jgi:hypothetical protein
MQTQDVELGFLAASETGPCPGVVLIHDVCMGGMYALMAANVWQRMVAFLTEQLNR